MTTDPRPLDTRDTALVTRRRKLDELCIDPYFLPEEPPLPLRSLRMSDESSPEDAASRPKRIVEVFADSLPVPPVCPSVERLSSVAVVPPPERRRIEIRRVKLPRAAALPDILTVSEAAAYLRVSESSLRRWIGSGLVRCARLGRILRFRREALHEWVKERETHRV